MRVIAVAAMPCSASAPSNARRLSPVCMPVSTSVHPSPARTRYTLMIVGLKGRGRNTCTTPSARTRDLPASLGSRRSLMLLVDLLLHREAHSHAHAPGRDPAVLDDGDDAVDLDLGLDALDRRGGARHREADGVLDR